MPDAYIGLGSNLGDRAALLEEARNAIAKQCGTITAASSVYETAPWGPVAQDDYLNQAVRIQTSLAPGMLLTRLRWIEAALGRNREQEVRYGPRTMDLDILYYEGAALDTPELTLPHPRILERAFVLVPLAEIAPDLEIGGKRVAAALAAIDPGTVRPYAE